MPLQITITGATLRRVLVGLLAGALLGGAGYGVFLLVHSNDPFAGFVDREHYQAVFLTDGRLLFGHLRSSGDEFYELRDVFFLRQSGGQRQVVRLANEFEGPENRVLISKDKVISVENLRSNSPVAEAIRRVAQSGSGG